MAALTIISLILLLIATYLLSFGRYIWDAFLLLCLATAGLLTAFFRTFVPRRSVSIRVGRLLPGAPARWVRLGALLLAIAVTLAARGRVPTADFSALFLLWIAAVASFTATLLVPILRQREIWAGFSRTEFGALLGLLLVAALVRGLALGSAPANLGGDEGTQLLAGLRLVERPMGNPFATGWYSVPTLSFVGYGLAMRVFGATIAGGRAFSAIVGTLTVLTTFLLGRALGGRRAGWIAALVVTFSAYHIHFSRLASNQILDPFIGTLAIGLLWVALDSRRLADEGISAAWGLSGIAAGLGWYAYFGARWVTLLIALILGWRALAEHRFLVRHRRGLLMFAAAWSVVVLPLLGWYTVHPAALYERYYAVSIFTSGWLTSAMGITGKSAARLLLEQFWKSATAFVLTPDPTFWYYPQRPLVDFVTAALFLVGMVAAFVRAHWPSRGLTLIWFWSALLMAWVLTENPPSSQRGLLLVPAVALFVAWGVDALERVLARHRQIVQIGLISLMSMMAALNLSFYFGVYTPRRTYGNPTSEIATEFARFALANPLPGCAGASAGACDGMVYFFGPPVLYWDYGGLAFLLRDQRGVDVMPGELPRDVISPARFVFVPGRAAELDAVMAMYPQGRVTQVLSPDDRALALVYDWMGTAGP